MAERERIDMKQGDTAPLPMVTLQAADGDPQDLTDCTVRFNVRKRGVLIVDHALCVIEDIAGGVVYFDGWLAFIASSEENAAKFAAMKGDYDAEFEVTFVDTKTRTYPNNSYIRLHVTEDVA